MDIQEERFGTMRRAGETAAWPGLGPGRIETVRRCEGDSEAAFLAKENIRKSQKETEKKHYLCTEILFCIRKSARNADAGII